MTTEFISYKKQSFAITTLLFAVLLCLLLFLKFNTTLEIPQMEGGGGGGNIAVNFGDSSVGTGENYENEETVTKQAKNKVVVSDEPEAILTNAADDEAVTVADVKKPKEESKPAEKPAPTVSKSALNALSGVLNSKSKSGDGNDNASGNKGEANGSTTASGYGGGGGSGSGSGGGNGSGQGTGSGSGYGSGSGNGRGTGVGNYQLSGRKAVSKPSPKYTCNEQGMVVVQITVNNNGQVTEAVAGVRGTTNTAKCLMDQARIAAQNTKFDANLDAPDKQVGKIIYNFKLSE